MFGKANSLSSREKLILFKTILFSIVIFILINCSWLFLSNIHLTSYSAFKELFHKMWFRHSIWLSIFSSTITTFIALILGLPAAYALSRYNVPFKKFIDISFSSVIVLPASTIGLFLMVAFQYPSILRIQQHLGFRIVHSIYSIVVAQLVLSLALGIKAWQVAFTHVNPRMEQVARTLGSSRIKTFFTVTIPIAKMGIITGIILAWTRAMAEFGAVLIFSETFRNRAMEQFPKLIRILKLDHADILPVSMWMEMEGGRTQEGVAIAFVLVIITMLSVYLLNMMGKYDRD